MTDNKPNPFRVALTGDFYDADGAPKFEDLGLGVFEGEDHIQTGSFGEHRPEIGPDQLEGAAAAIVLTPRVTKASLAACDDFLMIARFGVGYDTVDVDACTQANVLATITVGAVDRPVAEATLGWMLALSHNMLAKDRIVREGKWNDRTQYMGREIRDRTLGVIGLGGISRKLIELAKGLGMSRPIAYDPFVSDDAFEAGGARKVELDELLQTADFVSIHCPLNDSTRLLIGKRELSLMKPDAYLLNTARGGIVDEDALFEFLKGNRISGAAIDCFETEPVTEPSRFRDLENVILAPHCIAWTGELFRDIGRMACESVLAVSQGRRPHGVLNPELFEKSGFLDKWSRVTGAAPQ